MLRDHNEHIGTLIYRRFSFFFLCCALIFQLWSTLYHICNGVFERFKWTIVKRSLATKIITKCARIVFTKTIATGMYAASVTVGHRLRDLNLGNKPKTESGCGSNRTREAVDSPSEFEARKNELRRKNAPKSSTTEGKIHMSVQEVGELMEKKRKHQSDEIKCPIEACINIVTTTNGVQTYVQMKYLLAFKNVTFRTLFLAIPANLKREWVMSQI